MDNIDKEEKEDAKEEEKEEEREEKEEAKVEEDDKKADDGKKGDDGKKIDDKKIKIEELESLPFNELVKIHRDLLKKIRRQPLNLLDIKKEQLVHWAIE